MFSPLKRLNFTVMNFSLSLSSKYFIVCIKPCFTSTVGSHPSFVLASVNIRTFFGQDHPEGVDDELF